MFSKMLIIVTDSTSSKFTNNPISKLFIKIFAIVGEYLIKFSHKLVTVFNKS